MQEWKDSAAKTVPDVVDRAGFSYHVAGDLLIFRLDTGYLNNMNEDQPKLMREVCLQFPEHVKIAVYHEPIYPERYPRPDGAHTSSSKVRTIGLKAWVPIFDEFGFLVAFENHEHNFKRTKPLINDKPDPCGTYYLGDGAWGIE